MPGRGIIYPLAYSQIQFEKKDKSVASSLSPCFLSSPLQLILHDPMPRILVSDTTVCCHTLALTSSLLSHGFQNTVQTPWQVIPTFLCEFLQTPVLPEQNSQHLRFTASFPGLCPSSSLSLCLEPDSPHHPQSSSGTRCESPCCADIFPAIMWTLFGPSLMFPNIHGHSTCPWEDLFTSDDWCQSGLPGFHLRSSSIS